MKHCCRLMGFVMLGILAHSACGFEKDDPRVDGEYSQRSMTCSHTCLLMSVYILTIRNNSKILDAVQKDCCYFSVSENSSQSVLWVS